MIAPPAEAVTGARWSYKNVSSKRVRTGNDRTECLHGASSGNGPDDKLDALADFSVHRSVDSVLFMSSRRNRQQPPDAPAGSSRRGGVKNTHKTGHRQHDVIQLRGAVDVLPPTVQLEHCTTFYIYWTAQENNRRIT